MTTEAQTQSVQQSLTMRKYISSDEESVLQLLKLSLGESDTRQRTSEIWNWKHFQNPFGPSLVRVACDQAGEVVGLRAFIRWQFQMGRTKVNAVRAVDTATHPNYRRMGIFSTLTRQVVEDARHAGVNLVFNTPNQASGPGYLKMGWQYVGEIQPLIFVLNPSRFCLRLARAGLSRHKAGNYLPDDFFKHPLPEARTLLAYDQEVADLLSRNQESVLGKDTISTSADQAFQYACWRYTMHPNISYYTVLDDAGSHLRGCGLVRTVTRLGLKEVRVSEIWLAGPDQGLCDRLLDRIRSAAKADYLMAYAREGSFLWGALRNYGFRPFPRLSKVPPLERLLGQRPMCLVSRPLDSDLPIDPLQLGNWNLSMGDLEIF